MTSIPLAAQLIFAAPVAALLLGFFVLRSWAPAKTHWPILLSCAIVTAASLALAGQVMAGRSFDVNVWRWAGVEGWTVDFGLRVDGPGVAVLAMVAVVGSLIHVYAAKYMEGDPGFSRFFLVFHLFFLAMIGLLTANNYIQMYLFWELVGLASYLLIGYWHQKESARRAALQAFLTNRIGDFGFLLALLLILARYRVARFHLLYLLVAAGHHELLPVIGLLLVWAACAKSAQWPLYFWLPDAMEGPTPTSALMHAATMVTAGVFLLVRSWPLIAGVPGLPSLIAWVGGLTALGSAIIAGTKKDLKRILAYSTVSHLGLMMLALGLGKIGVAIFHLVVHGFFKAALFLCAGNVAHALHQPSANVDEVGGWGRAMPLTYAAFAASALSLSGVWPFAGFFSKDAIMEAAWERGGMLAVIAFLVGIGSAFYIFRMLFLTFHGERPEQRGLSAHPHEAEPAMAIPVLFLALGASFAGALGSGVARLVSSGLRGLPVGRSGAGLILNLPGEPGLPSLSWTTALLSSACVLLGAAAAYRLTMSNPSWDWCWRGGAAEALFDSDFGWKIFVARAASVVRATADFIGRVLDKTWWDGLLESCARGARNAGDLLSQAADGRLNDYLWWTAAGAALIVGRALR